MRDVDLTSKDIAALSATSDLMDNQWAPCRYHCPVHADVRKYIECVAEGKWRDAVDVIRENLALAVVCGRICHHPCETNCRRKDVDDSVAIREVKRFVVEQQGVDGATVNKPAVQDKARVAIIGGGPAGLAAALELARKGFRPTIFEKFPIAGGVCATAIPKYRLPRDVLQYDVDWILAHGVELVTGVDIGKDKTIADLKADGFAAVLIAAGLAKSRLLPIPGADNPRVFPVLDFLTALAFDEEIDIGSDVLVIGGGNVACDAARSAVRLGARVRMMCLEDRDEMPAWDWEIDEAVEEGVELVNRRGPVGVNEDGGKITSLTARMVTRVFDGEGRFAPEYDDADVIDIKCDTVIMAIGQVADTGFVAGSDLKLNDRGLLVFDSVTHQTSQPDVFACGEIVTPPGSAVEACASGMRVADAIEMFLAGSDIQIDDEIPPAIDIIDESTADKVIKVDRNPVKAIEPKVRLANFDPIDCNYVIDQAMCEARRCMSCGSGAEVMVDKCAACLTCLRVCPFDIPVVTDVARIESDKCQACGMCIAACPANAIVPRGRDIRSIAAQAEAALADGSNRDIVAFICGHNASASQWRSENETPAGVATIYLPSLASLASTDILAAFVAGARSVLVVTAAGANERYPEVNERITQRVAHSKQLLSEVGIDPDKLTIVELADDCDAAVKKAMAEAVAALEVN